MEDITFTPGVAEPVVPTETTTPSVITSDNARRKVQQSMVQLEQILKQLSGNSTM